MRRLSLLAAVLLAVAATAQTDRACVTVPRCAQAPVLDGVTTDAAFELGAQLGAFVTSGGGAIATPGTTCRISHDDRALYFAFMCGGLKPGSAFPRKHDDHVWEDDCVQVFIAPEDLNKAGSARINFGGYAGAYDNWYADIKAVYEFTVNACGSMSEARNDVRDWDAPWQAKVRQGAGVWYAEIAIPFSSLGVSAPADGALWGLNAFRMSPPGASGWVNPGHGGYTPLPLGAMCLANASPAARLEGFTPPRVGEDELTFFVTSMIAQPAELVGTVTPTGGEPITQSATLAARGTQELHFRYRLAGAGNLRARYDVRVRGSDTPLLSGFLPLSLPGRFDATLRYFALPGLLEGDVHLNDPTAATEAVLTLQPAAGPPTEARESLAGKAGTRVRLKVAGQPGDKLHGQLRVLDAAGKAVATHDLDLTIPERPAWLGTKAGLPLKVLPPWTPLQVQGKTVAMLGKRLTYGDLALPASIQSAGAELLAQPMRLALTAAGKPVAWTKRTCRVVEQAEDHVKLESVWQSAALTLTVTTNLEYDGFSWNEVTVTPRGKVSLDRLALEIPLKPERARYSYRGHAQACGAISPLGLRQAISNNLWIGDERRGIAWLAESLEWVQSQDQARQVEVVPGRQATVWRSTFVDTPTPLAGPYTARFILHVTPSKPVPLRKSRIFHGAYYGLERETAGGSLKLPVEGKLRLERGTFECWVKPRFDTNEVYDDKIDRSAYNRQLMFLFGDGSGTGEILILYYNADDRSFRLIKKDAAGQYPVIMGSPQRLTPGAWNYLAVSWGDKLRLSVNGKVIEQAIAGAVVGDPRKALMQMLLGNFDLDELRISSVERPIETVPTAAFTRDADTLFLDACEAVDQPGVAVADCVLGEGKFGRSLTCSPETMVQQLARQGKRIVIFHENWSRYQGYPDLAQATKLKAIADACHQQGMLFLVYFCQLMSDAAPEWPGLKNDFMALPERCWYHREDVKQDCYVSCVNGAYGDLLLDGIAKLADQAGIDGVYMDGTTVPWDCVNPTHDGCGEYLGDGTYLARCPIRQTREFMKRLRSIFAQRRKELFLDAHTGGCINIATQSFCDGFYDGETLARYKPGFRLAPEAFLTGYMGQQFGFRGDFLPNRHSPDEALAISLIHDTATRGQDAAVDQAWARYEDAQTQYVPYWDHSPLYTVTPAAVLGSLYLRPDRALLVLGSQTEAAVTCGVDVAPLLRKLPAGVQARDALTGETIGLAQGKLSLPLAGRTWRMIELR